MPWSDHDSPAALEELLEAGQLDSARELIHSLLQDIDSTARAVPDKVSKQITGLLRAYTLFEELEAVAASVQKNDPDNVRARVQYAQALIEQKRITSAIRELTSLKDQLEKWQQSDDRALEESAAEELPEVVGLLGRSYKQLYIDAQPNDIEPREHDLERAEEYYREAYDADSSKNYWHGINLVALLTNAERVETGNRRALSREAQRVASELLVFIEDDASYWGVATRIEAHLATGDTLKAIESCKACLALEYPKIDRFMLASTIRQLEEVWLLTEDKPPGNQILTPMKIRFAQLPGGSFVVDPRRDQVNRDELQRVWGDTSYRPVEWLDAALGRARAVARIGTSVHTGHGTGFLVDGAWFSSAHAGRHLVLTNAHVCSPDEEIRGIYGSLAPEAAVVAFLATKDPQGIGCKVLFSSPPAQLDATLLELDSVPSEVMPPKLTPLPSSGFPVAPGDRVSVIGHPHGGGMQVSIQDNKTKEVGERYLWYQTPTAPGSSGSPIFDQQWQLVGLHHASKAAKQANEGVRIDRILEAVRDGGQNGS